MKSIVIEKTKYILTNHWLGLLIPAGIHQLLNNSEKVMVAERIRVAHPAEYRVARNPGSKARP